RNKFREPVGERPARPAFAQAVEHPGTLANALDQPRVAHQLQVPTDPRLALAENLGDFADGQFAARKQRQKAETRAFRRRFQPTEYLIQACHWLIRRYKDIFISLSGRINSVRMITVRGMNTSG